MISKLIGPLFVAVAAFLWATDSLFRAPTVNSLNPIFIVMVEHLIGMATLFVWMLFRHRNTYAKLSIAQWLSAFCIGAFGSALATILFTASFRFINPSVAILLQKLQPIVVVSVAAVLLGEKVHARFMLWALVSLLAALVLSFPDLNFGFLRGGIDIKSRGVFYAFMAAMIWGVITVLGKILLRGTPPAVATFWRYVFGFAAAAMLLRWGPEGNGFGAFAELAHQKLGLSILYMGLVPGLLAMLFYYAGLSTTPASVATFVELIFPVGAILLNTIVLRTPLNGIQVGAAAVLLFAITNISMSTTQSAMAMARARE